MKIVFLTPYPEGVAPSQRFRFEQYAKFLKQENITFVYKPFLNKKAWDILYEKGQVLKKGYHIFKGFLRRFAQLRDIYSADYVFIHREASPIGPPIIEWCIARVLRKKIIYDFDDAIWLPNTSDQNRIARKLKWHNKVSKICKWSYKVSCGNEYLANYASQFNSKVVVNPTTIDTQNLHNPELVSPEEKHKITIGWTGTHSTGKYLFDLVPVLQKLEKTIDFRFLVISNVSPNLELKSLEYLKWNKNTEIQDLCNFDIGVMPLIDDQWAKGKCGFKALQYMALEIPVIASPVGVNTAIIDHGKDGFLCNSAEQWEEKLTALILDTDQRKKIGSKGRKKILDQFSVISNSKNFLNLFR